MRFLRTISMLAFSAFLAACATQKYAPDTAPEYVIIKDYTAFYRLGPMQASGPDATLKLNDRVKLLSREMGYSLIQLESEDRTGYIQNDAMAPAPPRPPVSSSTGESDNPSKKNGKRGTGAAYHGQPLNDTPLPDPKVPPPDLNIAPEEVPSTTPAPTPAPEKPKFRT